MTGFAPLPLDAAPSTQKLTGKAYISGPKWTHMPTLTVGLLGVQIFWSVEMGYASPYLLSLGLSKSSMAVVFLAGPLSGLIMQPVIGALADTSTSRFGRRRPTMLLGTLICVFAMLLLGYTRSFAAIFTTRGSPANNGLTIALAVFAVYLIDFSINAVMAMDRALLVDTLPPAQQAAGNAWAARMLGFGAVIGFFVGTIPLPSIFPFLGTTELQILSVIVSLLLFCGHMTMAICVKERVLLKTNNRTPGKRPNVLIREARELWSNLLTLPPVIRQICIIQFFAWICWFPQLFYTTIYVGDLYKRRTPLSSTLTASARDAEATRLGTRALFFSSLFALLLNLILPAFVATPATRTRTRRASSVGTRAPPTGTWGWVRVPERLKVNLASLWAVSHLVLAGCMLGTLFTDSVTGATLIIGATGFSWAITQWAPFSLLAEAILTTPSAGSRTSILLSDTRTPVQDPERAAFLDDADNDNADTDTDVVLNPSTTADPDLEDASTIMLGNHHARMSRANLADGGDGEWEDVSREDVRGGDEAEDGRRGSSANPGASEVESEGGGGLSAKAGIILGIHNVFIVIPQFLVTGLSAIVFAIFDGPQVRGAQPHIIVPQPPAASNLTSSSPLTMMTNTTAAATRALLDLAPHFNVREEGAAGMDMAGQSNSVVYIFRLGGISALIAFILCWRLARDLRHR